MSVQKKLLVSFLTFVLVLSLIGCGGSNKSSYNHLQSANVSLRNVNNLYYEVILDYLGTTPEKIGVQYGNAIIKAVPDYPQLIDSYLKELLGDSPVFFDRVNNIKKNLEKDYVDEINGMASALSTTSENNLGDGKLSVDELFLMNLLPDVGRATQCSAVAVYGERSINGRTQVGRVLDWNQGSKNQLLKLQAVVTFKNGNKSIATIGYLGFMGVISGFNDNNVFASILDSGDGQPYSSAGKRSYLFDLRTALETNDTLDTVAGYMSSKPYAYSHLIFLADRNVAKVLENDLSGGNRDLRHANSTLNPGITWSIDNAIGCVNSFVLAGNHDNHTGEPHEHNAARWSSLRTELNKRAIVTTNDLKKIITYKTGSIPGEQEDGDIYNVRTQQIIIFEPYNYNLQIFLRPESGLPSEPIFVNVSVAF